MEKFFHTEYRLVICCIALEDFPIHSVVIVHFFVNLYQRVCPRYNYGKSPYYALGNLSISKSMAMFSSYANVYQGINIDNIEIK